MVSINLRSVRNYIKIIPYSNGRNLYKEEKILRYIFI